MAEASRFHCNRCGEMVISKGIRSLRVSDMAKASRCCCKGCGEMVKSSWNWASRKISYPFRVWFGREPNVVAPVLSHPRVRLLNWPRDYMCGYTNSIDWDEQHCSCAELKDPFVLLKDGRIPVGIKDNYIDMFGLRERILFQPTLEKVVAAPGLVDERRDYRFCKPLAWGTAGMVAVALRNNIHITRTDNVKAKRELLLTLGSGGGPGEGPVTGVAWAPQGQSIALGFHDNGAPVIGLYDSVAEQWVGRSLLEGVGQHTPMCWNWAECNVLTYTDANRNIVCWDTKASSGCGPCLRSCQGGHKSEVTTLRWSSCGDRLASGDKDGVVCIWDINMGGRWVNSFHEERGRGSSAVRALSWYPIHTHDLAVCRGTRVSFLNTNNDVSFAELDTCCQLSGVAWAENEKFFITTYSMSGQGEGLAYWSYKGLARSFIHTPSPSSVLCMAESPDPSQIALGALLLAGLSKVEDSVCRQH